MVTAADIVAWIFDFVAQNGLLALVVVVALDSSLLLPIIPGELLLVAAVTQFAVDRPSLILTILAATLGSTLGSLMLYGVARGGGRGFIERHPKLFLMSPERREKMERLFKRPLGQLLVYFFRLFPFLRIIVSLPAGLARMPLLRFTILTVLGNLTFNAGLMWFVYESRQPNSAIARQIDWLEANFVSPAVALAIIHWLFVTAALVGLGILFVFVRAARMNRRPDGKKPAMSLISGVITIALFVAGVAMMVGLWADPFLVYDVIGETGWIVQEEFAEFPGGPVVVLGLIGALAISLSLMMVAIQRQAHTARERAAAAASRSEATARPPDAFEWRRGPFP